VSALESGATLGPRVFRITRADLVRYANASGDQNPIHQSDEVAHEVGLPGVIAHGMLTLGLIAQAVSEWSDHAEVLEIGAKFTAPVVVPDTDEGAELTVRGTVREIGEGRASLALEVTSGDRKVLGTPRAVVRA